MTLKKGVVGDLQRSGMKRSRLESPGSFDVSSFASGDEEGQ